MRIKVLIMTALLVAASNTNVSSQDMETKKTVTPQESKEHIVVLFEVKPKKEGKEEYLKLAAAWTWEKDHECFYPQFVSREAGLLEYAHTLLVTGNVIIRDR